MALTYGKRAWLIDLRENLGEHVKYAERELKRWQDRVAEIDATLAADEEEAAGESWLYE